MKKFNWVENYFSARVLLGFSEEEFWRSSPRKVAALIHAKHLTEGRLQPKTSNKDKAQEILNLLF